MDRSLSSNRKNKITNTCKTSFLQRVTGFSLRVEPLLLHIERSLMRWFVNLTRKTLGRLLGEVFQVYQNGDEAWVTPRTCSRDNISQLAREHRGVPPDKLKEVAGEREAPFWMAGHSVYRIFT